MFNDLKNECMFFINALFLPYIGKELVYEKKGIKRMQIIKTNEEYVNINFVYRKSIYIYYTRHVR